MKRITTLMLALLLVLMSFPIVANAAASSIYVGGVALKNGEYLAVDSTTPTTAKPSGGYAYYKDGVLTLSSYRYTGAGSQYMFNPNLANSSLYDTCVFSDGDLVIYCEGENYLTNTTEYGECISVRGNLTFTAKDEESGIGLTGAICAYVYSLDDDCELKVESGLVVTDAIYAGFDADTLCEGKKASITVDGGNVLLMSDDYGAVAYGLEEGSAGFYMNGGSVYVNAANFGILAESSVMSEVVVAGGELSVVANDVGIYVISEYQYSEFYLAGGTATIVGVENAVFAEKSYIDGSRIEAAYDAKNATSEAQGIFSGELYTSNLLEVIEGGFDMDYVVAEVPFTRGDVNDDGKIDQYDYILVKRHYFGTRILTDSEMRPADANDDGEVNQYDYILIKRHYFGTFTIV